MNAISETWSQLSTQKKVILVGAVAATLALVLMLARVASTPSMALLYGGLDQQTAGEVVAALDGMNVPSEVRGDSIYVPAGQRDRVRLSLAQQGLPQKGQAGYELLDQLSGFGTTSEMFQAAYWRAKEGELARTLLSHPGVQSARVHIGANARRPFERSNGISTASVTVSMKGGAPLEEDAAVSMRFLVALAVANLDPTQVGVIDARNGVVLRPGDERANLMSGLAGARRAEQLKRQLEDLIGRRVGVENVQVSVSVETTTDRETISERLIDPDSQVPTRAETETRSENTTGSSAAVTVASNLPDGDAANAGPDNTSQIEQTTEVLDYRYSETSRDQLIEPGAIKRQGVAVLINEIAEVGADGQVAWTPRDDAELTAIEELVKSAVAYDPDRGDVVTIESLRFAETPEQGVLAEASPVDQFVSDNIGALVQLGVLALVVLALGLFVVRPILTNKPAAEEEALQIADGATEGVAALEGLEIGDEAIAALTAEEGEPVVEGVMLDEPETETALNDLVSTRTEESAALLKKWLSDEDLGKPKEAA